MTPVRAISLSPSVAQPPSSLLARQVAVQSPPTWMFMSVSAPSPQLSKMKMPLARAVQAKNTSRSGGTLPFAEAQRIALPPSKPLPTAAVRSKGKLPTPLMTSGVAQVSLVGGGGGTETFNEPKATVVVESSQSPIWIK